MFGGFPSSYTDPEFYPDDCAAHVPDSSITFTFLSTKRLTDERLADDDLLAGIALLSLVSSTSLSY